MSKRKKNARRSDAAVVPRQDIGLPERVSPYIIVAIAVVTLIAYLPALGGSLVWNDIDYVTKPELRSLHGLVRIWFDVGATEQYYPLLHSFFWVQFQLWGDHPLGYHLVNLALHLAAVGLLYLILRKLRIPGAVLAAAIFALHPVMVESVAWITEQKNTLSTVFYLGAMLVYLHFDQTRKRSQYAAALALYLLALSSKTVTATLPAALLVIFWWKRGSLSWRRDVLPLAPWLAMGMAGGMFTAWVERNIVGAQGTVFDLTLPQRCLIAGRVPWSYVSKLLCPANLIFMYPRWKVDPTVWWQWLFPLATIALLIALWLVRHRWRGPLAGWLLFIGTLVPVLGFLNVFWFSFSFAADHLQYLASLPVIVLVACGMALVVDRLQAGARPVGKTLCIVILAVLGVRTWQQAQMFSDAVTLYQTTIDRNPTCWLAYTNLSGLMNNYGRTEEAIKYSRAAVQLKPDYAQAHNNLGVALAQSGRLEEAIAEYRLAIEFESFNPTAYNNLGNALVKADRPQEALHEYELALQQEPTYSEAHANLAAALGSLGRWPEAIGHYQQALRIKPENVDALANMALAYAATQRPADAIDAAGKALALARSTGQTALAAQIENWLTKYRAEHGAPQ